MTLYQFNALSEKEQAQAVAGAVKLADRLEDQYCIILYQIDAFYVEVFRDRDSLEINRFRPFTTTKLLEPYLLQIEISDLKDLL